MERCPICSEEAQVSINPNNNQLVNCSRCGFFHAAAGVIASLEPTQKPMLRGWIYERNALGERPVEIRTEDADRAISQRAPALGVRCERLLLEAAQKNEYPGQSVDLVHSRLQAATYSSRKTLEALCGQLQGAGLVEDASSTFGGNDAIRLTYAGYVRVEELQRVNAHNDQGFVAMSFDSELDDAWKQGFEVGITNAGYRPIRMDHVEHVDKIDDRIIAEIRRSRFVVADFTGHKGGVYFESGFALGLTLPIIWTCRKDQLGDLHFDVQQYNTIDWETPADLATRLEARTAAVLGDGPHKSK